MNTKTNALELIRFGSPERIEGSIPCVDAAYFGANHQDFANGIGHDRPLGSRWHDIWGVGWHKEHAGVMGYPEEHPLADPEDLDKYAWPDPDDERICQPIYEKADQADTSNSFLCGSHRDTLWERSYMLVGMEDMMESLLVEPEFAREIFHRIMDFQLGIARHYVKAGVEIVNLSDDMGTQTGPLLGPDLVQSFLVPEYERLTSYYRKHNVLMNFHSCGNIHFLVPILIDLGINILNPVQATANDQAHIRALTQGRMALAGGVSSRVVMDGPVAAIEEEVRRCLWTMGRNGGYVCAPDQGMPYPEAHRQAVEDAVERWGAFPISEP